MSNKNHKWIVFTSLIIPILFYIAGFISSTILDKLHPEHKGTGSGFGAAVLWMSAGVISFLVSIIIGPLLTYISRKYNKPKLINIGYLIAPTIAFIAALIVTVLEAFKNS